MQGLEQWTWDEGQGLPPDAMGSLKTEEGVGSGQHFGKMNMLTWITEGWRDGELRGEASRRGVAWKGT